MKGDENDAVLLVSDLKLVTPLIPISKSCFFVHYAELLNGVV